MAKKYYFFQNKITEAKNVRLSPNDLGFLRGYGIFDFLRTFAGKPFLLKEHLQRFQNSAKLLNLPLPKSKKELTEIINKLLKKNNFREATIRLVLTGGVGKDSLTPRGKPSFLILAEPLHPFPREYYTKGIKLITTEYQRDNPRAKTLNYTCLLQNKPKLNLARAQEILYTSKGNVLECSTSNFFIFKNNALITPKDDILIGTTRNLVLKLARKKFKVNERKIRIKELKEADEIFITATIKRVMPVTKINNLQIGNSKVGKNTKILMNLFTQYIEEL